MKKANFLTKLQREGKVALVEPSEETQRAYMQKSESYLASAKLLLKNNRLEEAVSITYYCMYYMLLALLFRVGIKSENHMASILLLEKVFGIDNQKIMFAKEERIDKQYYIDFQVTKKDVEDLVQIAESFISDLANTLATLTNENIRMYREKAHSMWS